MSSSFSSVNELFYGEIEPVWIVNTSAAAPLLRYPSQHQYYEDENVRHSDSPQKQKLHRNYDDRNVGQCSVAMNKQYQGTDDRQNGYAGPPQQGNGLHLGAYGRNQENASKISRNEQHSTTFRNGKTEVYYHTSERNQPRSQTFDNHQQNSRGEYQHLPRETSYETQNRDKDTQLRQPFDIDNHQHPKSWSMKQSSFQRQQPRHPDENGNAYGDYRQLPEHYGGNIEHKAAQQPNQHGADPYFRNQYGSNYKTLQLYVPVCCEACEERIVNSLSEVEGVMSVRCDVQTEKVTVTGRFATATIMKKTRKLFKRSEIWTNDD